MFALEDQVPKHVHLGYYTIGNTMSTRYGERLCELGMSITIRPVFNFNVQPASMVARMVYLIWNARKLFCRVLLSARLRHGQPEHCSDPNFYCPEGTNSPSSG